MHLSRELYASLDHTCGVCPNSKLGPQTKGIPSQELSGDRFRARARAAGHGNRSSVERNSSAWGAVFYGRVLDTRFRKNPELDRKVKPGLEII